MEIYDFGITTLEGIVGRVNTGPTQGFEHLTAEYLAASYAASAALEGSEGGEIDAESIEAHLDVLSEAGAKFHAGQATQIGLELVKASAEPQKSFIETAASRETSIELMQAILQVAGGDEAKAEAIWADGPDNLEMISIIEIVKENGAATTDFSWGAAGTNWAYAESAKGREMQKVKYEANDALSEIEEALAEMERSAEALIVEGATPESVARGQGIHTATRHIRFRIKNIRRGEGI